MREPSLDGVSSLDARRGSASAHAVVLGVWERHWYEAVQAAVAWGLPEAGVADVVDALMVRGLLPDGSVERAVRIDQQLAAIRAVPPAERTPLTWAEAAPVVAAAREMTDCLRAAVERAPERHEDEHRVELPIVERQILYVVGMKVRHRKSERTTTSKISALIADAFGELVPTLHFDPAAWPWFGYRSELLALESKGLIRIEPGLTVYEQGVSTVRDYNVILADAGLFQLAAYQREDDD